MSRSAEEGELIPTRTTLIQRLKNWQDQSSWQDFFDTYWKLIYGVAVKSGLTKTEAEDVVQETMFSVAKHMPNFKYDRKLGSFKGWLLNMTRWRIIDQFRKREHSSEQHLISDDNEAMHHTEDKLVNHTNPDLEALWDAEWEKNLFDAAVVKVKRSLDPQKYQIFDFYANKQWTPEKVAKTFGISVAQVYLAKHRVIELIKEEVQRLEAQMG
jgi:RNA polymerase sigma factor (sigma-70 family)